MVRNCTVRFENGEEVKNVNGGVGCKSVRASNVREETREQRIGMERTMNCGYRARIIDYINSRDITVLFTATGNIAKHMRFDNFMNGK